MQTIFRTFAWQKHALSLVLAPLAGMLIAADSPAFAAPTATPPAGCTGPASKVWIKVVVQNVRSKDGLIAITLYADNSSRFLAHHGALYVGFTPAVAGTTETCIFLPRTGVYALAIYHDANSNKKFDRNSLGLPAEGYGFSNNAPTLLGLPAFRQVRMSMLRNGMTTHIALKYP